MDAGELLYFKDSSLSEKNGEVPLCGAIVSYIDDSTATGCASIEIHSGKRDLLLECDSSFVAEVRTVPSRLLYTVLYCTILCNAVPFKYDAK